MDIDALRRKVHTAVEQAGDYVVSGEPDFAEFCALEVEIETLFGVPCEVECSYTLNVLERQDDERQVKQMFVASISDPQGGPAYGQALIATQCAWSGSTEALDIGKAAAECLAEAREKMLADADFQRLMALAEAAELRESIDKSGPRRRLTL